MSVLRHAAFITLFWSWAVATGIALVPLLVLPRHLMEAAGCNWVRGVMWIAARTGGMHYRITGRENLPDGPAIIASKHQSVWDTMILLIAFRDPVAVIKRELLWIPFYGWYAKKIGVIAINRRRGVRALRRMVEDAKRWVALGRSPVVFPEGTRTLPGERRPYHGGVALLYEQLGLPVVPVALNSGLFWPRRRFYVLPGCITLKILPPIAPGLGRAELMTRLEDTIETASAALATPEDLSAESAEPPVDD